MKHFTKFALALALTTGFVCHNSTARVIVLCEGNGYVNLNIYADATEEQLRQEFEKRPDVKEVHVNYYDNGVEFLDFVKRHPHLATKITEINSGNYSIKKPGLITLCEHCKNLTSLEINVDDETIPEEVGELSCLKSLEIGGESTRYLPESLRAKVCTQFSNFFLGIDHRGPAYFDMFEFRPIATINFKNGTGRFFCNGSIEGIERNLKKAIEINFRAALFHKPRTFKREGIDLAMQTISHGLESTTIRIEAGSALNIIPQNTLGALIG
ncbi:hypothetical protein HOD08_02895 [bacterium]|nr:hypothetical protein [bacterium]